MFLLLFCDLLSFLRILIDPRNPDLRHISKYPLGCFRQNWHFVERNTAYFNSQIKVDNPANIFQTIDTNFVDKSYKIKVELDLKSSIFLPNHM